MVAYRFCRPDDIGLLVRAVNECYDIHFPGRSPLTLADFQREVRELDVWPSNCMVAGAAGEPLAVCIATRREREVLIYRVGCRPGHLRQGHGGHILTSLSRKLAVLGPSRLAAEVPEEWNIPRLFFESLGYREETVLTDFILEKPPPPPPSLRRHRNPRLIPTRHSSHTERQVGIARFRNRTITETAVIASGGHQPDWNLRGPR